MVLGDDALDRVVRDWHDYAQARPAKISARDVLVKRNLHMYRGLGINNASDLSRMMVNDRSAASLEMTMGHLYELLLGSLGPVKLTKEDKTATPAYQGIDFIQRTPNAIRVINLKAGLATVNSDISNQMRRRLKIAKEFELHRPAHDDNPLQQNRPEVIMVRAVARGAPRNGMVPCNVQGYQDDQLLYLVGASLWEYFGGGQDFLHRVQQALGQNPLDFRRHEWQKARAAVRVRRRLMDGDFVGPGRQIRWDALIERYP